MNSALLYSRVVGCILGCMLVSMGGQAFAADQVIYKPVGWELDHENAPFDIAGNRIVFVLYQYQTTDPENHFAQSRVVQAENAVLVWTDFSGKVGYVDLAPDGSNTLIHQSSGSRSLVDGQGVITWTMSDPRILRFSTTGQSITAAHPGLGGYGAEIEIFELSGRSFRSIDFDGPIIDHVTLGAGHAGVVSRGRTVRAWSYGEDTAPISESWVANLPADSITRFSTLQDSFVAYQIGGKFTVLSASGVVRYEYDPVALADADPGRDESDYVRFRPYPGSASNIVLLFDGTESALELDLDTGTLVPKALDLSGVPGSVVRTITPTKVVLFAPSQVVLRDIP